MCSIEPPRPSRNPPRRHVPTSRSGVRRRNPFASLPQRIAQAYRERGLRGICAALLAVPGRPQPDPAHRLPQRRGPARAGHRHSLSLAVPRRPDRRAGAEPRRAGRDHRQRHRRVRDRRQLQRLHRSATACSNCSRAKATDPATKASPAWNSRSIRSAIAPALRRLISPTKTRARIYDRNGYPDPRQPQPLHPRRSAALRPAAADRRSGAASSGATGMQLRIWLGRGDLPLYRELGAGGRQGLSGGRRRAARQQGQHGARQRARRGDRLGGGAGAALPRRARRAAAVDAGRRHRPGGGGRAAGRSSSCS